MAAEQKPRKSEAAMLAASDPTRFEIEATGSGRLTLTYRQNGQLKRRDFFMPGETAPDRDFVLLMNPGSPRPFDMLDPTGPLYEFRIRRVR